METPLKSTTVLFKDHFSTDGKLNAASWDYNHWQATNNPSWLGLMQMRQELPDAQNGMARIRLDTWLDGNGFKGSEAITKEAWDLSGGSVAKSYFFDVDYVKVERVATLMGGVCRSTSRNPTASSLTQDPNRPRPKR